MTDRPMTWAEIERRYTGPIPADVMKAFIAGVSMKRMAITKAQRMIAWFEDELASKRATRHRRALYVKQLTAWRAHLAGLEGDDA